MRILVLTTKPPWPPRDGGAVASMRMIEGLTSQGATVSVLSMTTPKHAAIKDESYPPAHSIKLYKKIEIDTTINPRHLLKNFLFSCKPYDLKRFHSQEFVDLISSLPDIRDYDIIQCEGLVFALYAREIRQITQSKIVLRAHNIEHHIREMMARQEKGILKRWYLKNLSSRIRHVESECRELFDAIIAITANDKRWFDNQRGSSPVTVSETGMYPDAPLKENKSDKLKVGFIGALDWKPNADGLLWFLNEVWPDIVKNVPSASFYIAGRNASPELSEQLTGRNVVFEGEIIDAEHFTSAMTVMVAPLFAGSGIRIKIIEAMNTGIPVVASIIAARGLPVTDKKDIFICANKHEFVTSVTELLTITSTREKIINNAKALIKERYDNNRLTAQLFEFYNTLCDGC